MQIDNNLFITMLGDYYLHAHVFTHSQIAVNNYTSSIIETLFDNVRNKNYGFLLKYQSKPYLVLVKYQLDSNNNISFYDLNGNQIEPVGYISPFDGKYYTDTKYLIQQSNINRVSSFMVYVNLNKVNYILDVPELFSNLTFSDVLKAVISKYIFFSPENKNYLSKLLSVVLGSPVILSPDGETVQYVSQEKIITDKWIYQLEPCDECIYPSIGNKLNFLDPILIKTFIVDGIKYDFDYSRLIATDGFSLFYKNKLIDTLIKNKIFLNIPSSVLSDSSDTIKNISTVFKQLKLIYAETMTFLSESENVFSKLDFRNILQEKTIFNFVEKFSISIQNMVINERFDFTSFDDYKIKSTSVSDTIKKDDIYALKTTETRLNLKEQSNPYKQYSDDFEIYETTDKSSFLNTFTVSNIDDFNKFNILNADYFNLPTDSNVTKISDKSDFNLIEKDVKTVYDIIIDTLNLPFDNLTYKSVTNITADQLINNSFNSSLQISEQTLINNETTKSNIIAYDLLSTHDETNTSIIDKSNISIYNIDKYETAFSQSGAIEVSEDNVIKDITKSIIESHDEMDIVNNTTIDKE